MKNHYSPNISRFYTHFEESFRLQEYSLDQYIDTTYDSVFKYEMKRIRDAPLAFENSPLLFSKNDLFSSCWNFSSQPKI